jgi:hypothetical protein
MKERTSARRCVRARSKQLVDHESIAPLEEWSHHSHWGEFLGPPSDRSTYRCGVFHEMQ